MIYVNGNETDGHEGRNLKEFLLEQGFTIERIAVECNGDIIPKAAYDNTFLKDGDKLEVVNFVGGG